MSRIREQVILRTKSNSGIRPTLDPMSLEKTWGRENAKEAFTISHEHLDQPRSERTTGSTIHHAQKQLKIYPLTKPMVHKRRPMASEGRLAFKEKVFHWLKEGLIRKDMYPLSEEGEGLASLKGYLYKCFLRLPKEYSQIRMAKGDEEKPRFHTKEGFGQTNQPLTDLNVPLPVARLHQEYDTLSSKNISSPLPELFDLGLANSFTQKQDSSNCGLVPRSQSSQSIYWILHVSNFIATSIGPRSELCQAQ
ncbi:hypothetical protein Tco_0020278 [Tanacetum coccineum]